MVQIFSSSNRQWLYLSDDHLGIAANPVIRGCQIFFYQRESNKGRVRRSADYSARMGWRQRFTSRK